MTLAHDRSKWNRRYAEGGACPAPEPNALAMRFRAEVHGGTLLDAACGLGAGIAALLDRVDRAIGVDLSEAALAAAQEHWRAVPTVSLIQGDAASLDWPPGGFSAICAFGFTDWRFLRRVPGWLRPGGLVLYQGFSRRQLTVKPNLNEEWTSTPESIAALFGGWRRLACEESETPPYRVSFAALRPTDPKERA